MCKHNIPLDTPIIIAGDFNSLPNSSVYSYLTHPHGLPWTTQEKLFRPEEVYGSGTRFLCDHSLSRLCRWMRILGIDTAIQSTDGSKNYVDTLKSTHSKASKEEAHVNTNTNQKAMKLRKHKSSLVFEAFFEKAKQEKRIVLTTSKQMVERANCPPCLLVPSSQLGNLEVVLAEVVRKFSLTLDPDKFLTVCGKCGGEIEIFDMREMQERISTGNVLEDETLAAMATKLLDITGKVQNGLPTDRPLFACVECKQPYWWNSKESSSPARAVRMAEKLYKTVQMHLASLAVNQSEEESGVVAVTQSFSREKPVDTTSKVDDQSNVTDLNAMFAKRDKYVGSSPNVVVSTADTDSAVDTTIRPPTHRRLHLTSAFARKHSGAEPETTNWCEEFSG